MGRLDPRSAGSWICRLVSRQPESWGDRSRAEPREPVPLPRGKSPENGGTIVNLSASPELDEVRRDQPVAEPRRDAFLELKQPRFKGVHSQQRIGISMRTDFRLFR